VSDAVPPQIVRLAAVVSGGALLFGGPLMRLSGAWGNSVVELLLVPALALDRAGLIEHGSLGVQAVGLLYGSLLFGAFVLAERRPGLGAALAAVAVVPPLLGLIVPSIGLAPGVFVGASVGLLVRSPSPPALPPPPPTRGPLSWMPRRRWGALAVALGVGLVASNGLTMLTSGPGDAQTPLELLLWLDGLPGRRFWPLLALLALVLPADAAGRAASLVLSGLVFVSAGFLEAGGMDAVYGASTIPLSDAAGAGLDAALAAVAVGCLAQLGPGRGPLRPARVAALFAVPLLTLLHVACAGFLGCDAVRADPRVEVLSARPGAFAVQPVSGGVFASFRDDGVVERLALGGGRVVIDPTDLALPAWAGQEASGLPARTAYPEELGLDPQGRVHAFVELPGDEPAMALLLLDGATGEVLEARQGDGGCFVSSWVMAGDEAVAGCEWSGRLLRFAPHRGLWFDPLEVGGGELEELVFDPTDGTLLTTGLWSSPWLRRIDPATGSVVGRIEVGTFAWGLALDGRQRPWVAQFHGRVLRRFTRGLQPDRRGSVGYGVRSLAYSPRADAVLAASGYDGHLYAVDWDLRTRRLRLGGWLREVVGAPAGAHAVVAGMCGVLRVQLDSWVPRRPPSPAPP
jgi:hypothetical protein